MNENDMSIADLCAPLSAKVMPKRTLYTSDHQPRTHEQAHAKQRSSEAVRVWKRRKTRKEIGL